MSGLCLPVPGIGSCAGPTIHCLSDESSGGPKLKVQEAGQVPSNFESRGFCPGLLCPYDSCSPNHAYMHAQESNLLLISPVRDCTSITGRRQSCPAYASEYPRAPPCRSNTSRSSLASLSCRKPVRRSRKKSCELPARECTASMYDRFLLRKGESKAFRIPSASEGDPESIRQNSQARSPSRKARRKERESQSPSRPPNRNAG